MRWKISNSLEDYVSTINFMESEIIKIKNDQLDDLTWLLEYPSLYTAGLTANSTDLLDKDKFPVYQSKRGGKYTYHGPGQRVVYVMLDLERRNQKDIRKFIENLEKWIIEALAEVGVEAKIKEGRVGIWVDKNDEINLNVESKIAAIGIRIKKWVTFHGVAVNISPDMQFYDEIIPCGIKKFGVTSLKDVSSGVTMEQFDQLLISKFKKVFNI